MAWVAVGTAAVSLIGGAVSADSARSAGHQQADAAKAASEQNAAMQKPWVDTGSAALTRLSAGLQPGGEYTKKFSMADATNSPAEKEALRRSSESIQNSAAAKGGLIGSNVMDQLEVNAGSIAAGFEGQAFNQWNSQQGRDLAGQQSLAQLGQTAVTNTADNNSNGILAAGGANAGATVAGGNAINGAIGSIGNILGQSKLFTPTTTTDPNLNPGVSNPVGNDAVNIGAGYAGTDYSLSDERLKTDVEHVGQTNGGLPIYKYRMKGQRAKQMGVMAQDVERSMPQAVARHPQNGFRMVDYGQVK